MNINSRNIYIVYLFLYFSLLVGFYFNEDFGGYFLDYSLHKDIVSYFDENFNKSFLNFDKLQRTTNHSPIYIIFLLFLQKISFSETFARLISLHLCLLIPYFFYLCLKSQYKFRVNDIKIILPAILFLSPYFRSASFWIGSENISLIFLSICFYFFIKYKNSKKKELSYIIMNTLFLALAAYIRPIYALFSIYFFVRYYFDLNISYKLLFYIFINILFSFPAIYYVFVLDVNFLQLSMSDLISLSEFANKFSIILTILFFYSLPFLLINIKQNFQINNFKIENLVLSIIILFFIILYFDYSLAYGGGFFYKFSILVFKNNYLFYFFFFVSLNVFIIIFINFTKNTDRIFDFTLFLVLIFLEVDNFYYHETYDPLLYLVYFLLLKNKIYLNFANTLTNRTFILLGSFSLSFYFLSILKVAIKF